MTKPDRPTVRLFVEEELVPDRALHLSEEASHYLRNVMRRDVGAVVGLFNGRGPELSAELTKVGKKSVEVQLGEEVASHVPLEPLCLYFAPIKRSPMELVIAKATELGVTDLQPVVTDLSQSERLRYDRLRNIAIEAAEQSERLCVPTLREPITLAEMLEESSAPIGVAIETPQFLPLKDSLGQAGKLAGLFVGPEGGFSESEQALFAQNPKILGFGLGPRILKAETAAIALLAVYQALQGDWDQRPDFRGATR